jgi:hypothetical protein
MLPDTVFRSKQVDSFLFKKIAMPAAQIVKNTSSIAFRFEDAETVEEML